MSSAVFELKDAQREAVEPGDNVWLSASAGTGKTQVLSARVLRLLLRAEVEPGAILCLTFTKAGAAEMANRINSVLARWVRLGDTQLGKELQFLGAPMDPATRERARTLFASVLDCPGGGLRIDTIHAFSQYLLSNFPEESGLNPGTRPMEDRERSLLAREVLADVLERADDRLTAAVDLFVTRKDEKSLQSWVMRCARVEELWAGPTGWQSPVDGRVRAALGIPLDPAGDGEWVAQVLHPDIFPDAQMRSMLPLMKEWTAKSGKNSAAFIEEWLVLPAVQRAERVADFKKTILKQDGDPRKMDKPAKKEPRLIGWQNEIAAAVKLYDERLALMEVLPLLIAAFEIGRAFALRWSETKAREGLIEFDDLIRRAAILLNDSAATQWIRYKLDRSFDHILIDEAQDTNQSQWDIIDALIDDFFSGDGASGDTLRTIFTVGDYKQAIFGFQGTSPDNYERAKQAIGQRISAAREQARALREDRIVPNWKELDLGRSFRTSDPLLCVVNRMIERLGHAAFGLPGAPPPHIGEQRAGMAVLWPPVRAQAGDDEDDEKPAEEGEAERDWLPHHDTMLAEKIAAQIDRWLNSADRYVLENKRRRYAQAGDIMVLVRKRGGLAAQIVAKLHERRVPVAGVDRLRLGNPLAVKDVMAALRFASQPLDDLSCANLLASPIIGWTQNDLLEHLPRPARRSVWEHLTRKDAPPFAAQTAEMLRELLRLADYETPQALIAWLLTGPWKARRKLVARLGREANDPLDELINAAFSYESAHTPSLAGFIQWFDSGDAELKRDPDDAAGQVRVLTVHGSKGLQAPIVILADATGAPGDPIGLELEEGQAVGESRLSRRVPVPALNKGERVGPIADAAQEAEREGMEEHWRLLYVAMTRAEEALFIGGALGKRQAKKGPPEDSWYAHLAELFDAEPIADPIWDERRELGQPPERMIEADGGSAAAESEEISLPDWALVPIGPEPRPPRPLAPSGAGEDAGAEAPLAARSDPAATRMAMQRGILIHRLLERLPDIAPEARRDAGAAWLERQGRELDEAMRTQMLDQALAVIATKGFEAIFGPDALAEIPLAAQVDGVVITGTVDRLLVTPDAVQVIDFKTTSRPPRDAADVPFSSLRQMAAYVAALKTIYPHHSVSAALLYTQTPSLIELSPEALASAKQDLGKAQESFPASAQPSLSASRTHLD